MITFRLYNDESESVYSKLINYLYSITSDDYVFRTEEEVGLPGVRCYLKDSTGKLIYLFSIINIGGKYGIKYGYPDCSLITNYSDTLSVIYPTLELISDKNWGELPSDIDILINKMNKLIPRESTLEFDDSTFKFYVLDEGLKSHVYSLWNNEGTLNYLGNRIHLFTESARNASNVIYNHIINPLEGKSIKESILILK